MKNAIRYFAVMALPLFFFGLLMVSSCEGPRGPMGPAGTNGTNGTNGVDANETCKQCHTPDLVDQLALEFEFSKHFYGEAAFEEAGNTGCSPCHTQEAFLYVVENNVPATYALNTAVPPKYTNQYVTSSSKALGEIRCGTCHAQLHETYTSNDNALTTTSPVGMLMWSSTKTINLTQDNGRSNLCVKCHQPRPLASSTSTSNGGIIPYDSLAMAPTALFYDSTITTSPNRILPSYRMHVHYGTVGAMFAGEGGVEFSGSKSYTNSTHTSAASCQDCHMAARSGRAGGHTFMVQGNFNGCNASGCHTGLSSSSSTLWTTPRATIKGLLDQLATKINAAGGGTDLLHKESDSELNLWVGQTTNNYDGYLDIYLPGTNDAAAWRNPSQSGMTAAQITINQSLPKFPSLKNVQVGAMVNFQMALRESSLGIHNYKYSEALLTNTIEAMTAAGF